MQADVKDITKYETVNEETATAMEEAKLLKADPYKKIYNFFAEIMEEIDDEQ